MCLWPDGRKGLRFVRPRTVLEWQKRRFRDHWRRKSQGGRPGRPHIDPELRVKIALDLKRSIAYALGHREEALEWAMQFAGKLAPETLDRFVQRYVNDLSLDCGERGRQAARKLFEESHRHGFLPEAYEPVYHGDEQADL